MVDLLCFVACTLLFVSEELLPAASPWEIGVERSWVGIAGAEGANSFSQLPALHHTVASFKPEPGSSAGPCPRAELWEFTCGSHVLRWQPALPCHPGGHAGCRVLGFGSCLHPLITLLQALGCFLPGRLCRCEERGVRLHSRAGGATFL